MVRPAGEMKTTALTTLGKKPRCSTFMPRHARDKLTRSWKHINTHLTCGVFCRATLLDLPGVF
jgi:hypothetical protein